MKDEEKKTLNDYQAKLAGLSGNLSDLLFSTRELAQNVRTANIQLSDNLSSKIKSDLESLDIEP